MHHKNLKRGLKILVFCMVVITGYLYIDNPFIAPKANARDEQSVTGGLSKMVIATYPLALMVVNIRNNTPLPKYMIRK